MNNPDIDTPQAPRPVDDPPVLLGSPAPARFIPTTLQGAIDAFAEAGSFGAFENDPHILPGHIVVFPDYDPKRFSPPGYVRFHADSNPFPLPLCVVTMTAAGFVPPNVNLTRAEFLTPPQAHAWCALRPAVRILTARGPITLEQAARAWAPPAQEPDKLPPVRLTWRLATERLSAAAPNFSHFRTVWEALDFARQVRGISGMHSPEITATGTDEVLLTRQQIRRIL